MIDWHDFIVFMVYDKPLKFYFFQIIWLFSPIMWKCPHLWNRVTVVPMYRAAVGTATSWYMEHQLGQSVLGK